MAHFTSAMLFVPVHGGCYIISKCCDLSVLAVSMMGFQNKFWIGFELYPIFVWIFGIFYRLVGEGLNPEKINIKAFLVSFCSARYHE